MLLVLTVLSSHAESPNILESRSNAVLNITRKLQDMLRLNSFIMHIRIAISGIRCKIQEIESNLKL